MITYKTFMVPRRYPIVFTCNWCGYVMDCEKNEYEEFMTDTIHQFKVTYGYGSERDGQTAHFDLCEKCLEKLYKSFAIQPETKEWI